jgi:DNA helicase-2/ATP-dependent DNA helicase PcrA
MAIDLAKLDAGQRSAVTAPDGPVLVFAGAGSGKTRTLVARVAHLIGQGVPAHEIMAVTFTRKAADEMRNRLTKILRPSGHEAGLSGLRVGTFHAQMAMALRLAGPEALARFGRSNRFTVYDEDDRERTIRAVLKEIGLDGMPGVTPGGVAGAISRAKNDGLTSERAGELSAMRASSAARAAARVWAGYEERLRAADAMDFDDLLLLPVLLLEQDAAVRDTWSRRIRYLLVDEFQDTNAIQMRLVRALSSVHGNLFVVGDDAQSIYSFRGAEIRNILDFAKSYPGATVVTLETNYRSTQPILDLANVTLAHNTGNVPKTLKAGPGNPRGGKPVFVRAQNEWAEARFLAESAYAARSGGIGWAEMAILVRTNAQTRVLEQAFAERGIPYRVLGGVSFWARTEVRDLVAYLRLLANPRDGAALRRAIGAPSRGIGAKALEWIEGEAKGNGYDYPAALRAYGKSREGTTKGRNAATAFADLMAELGARVPVLAPMEIANLLLSRTGLIRHHNPDGSDEGQDREANLREAVAATEPFAPGELSRFLETAVLDTTTGSEKRDPADALSLATLHATKGLEWPWVAIAGCEEGILPHGQSSDEEGLEEERRLFYVGVTRAQRQLTLSAAAIRSAGAVRGPMPVSRFIREAADTLLIRR